MQHWVRRLDDFFQITARGSTWRTEIIGGVATFLAMSYIVVINPNILSDAGIPWAGALFATVVASALGTIAFGVFARLPFVLAPGMELNAFIAYQVIRGAGMPWTVALAACFVSAILFVLLTVVGARQMLIHAIPEQLHPAIAACVGIFIALVGFRIAGVLEPGTRPVFAHGWFWRPETAILFGGFTVAAVLHRLGVRAAVLISIVGCAVVAIATGLGGQNSSARNATALLSAARWPTWPTREHFGPFVRVVITVLVIDFVGSVAKLIGLSARTSMAKNGSLPRMNYALAIDGTSSIGGALLGTTNLTVYVESGVGIAAGARTGIAAVTCGLLLASSITFWQLLSKVPLVAVSGSLFFVGYNVVTDLPVWRSRDFGFIRAQAGPLLIGASLTVFSFALDKAMAGILLAFVVSELAMGRRPATPMILTSLLFVGAFLA